MIREEFKQKLERRHSKLVLIWLAFVVGDFNYVWVAHFLLDQIEGPLQPGFSDTVRTAIWILAAAVIWALYGFYKKRIFTRQAFFAPPPTVKVSAALRAHASPVEEKAAVAVSAYFVSKVVTFAFAGAIAIFGFVLAFVGHYVTDEYLLTLVSLGILAYEFPSKSFLRGLVGEIEIRAELAGHES
jgi:drug/metabolite transporter (DMT)-like permease